MKLSFVIGGLRGGGTERVCVTLANALAERGYDIDLVVLGLEGAVRHAEIFDRVRLVDLGVHHTRNAMPALSRYLRGARPACVVSFNSQISVILVLLRKIGRQRFRLISRSPNFLSIVARHRQGIWHRWIVNGLIRLLLRHCDLHVAQSRAMGDDLASYLDIPSERIVVINNPLSIRFDEGSSLSPHERRRTQDYIVMVGRLEEQKAIHRAIEAFALLSDRHPQLRLKIVGKGSRERSLREAAARAGVGHRVDFEGFHTDLAAIYGGARVTVLTSLYEGFPNVLIESIACGTPVVAFDCLSGPSEIVVEGVNGYLVPQGDVSGLADAIDLALGKEFDHDALIATVTRFSRKSITDAFEKVVS